MGNPKAKITNVMKYHQWKKGQSGNPNGRPKKDKCLTTILKKIMGDKVDAKASDLTYEEATVLVTIEMALQERDPKALREIWERMDGKVAVPIGFEITKQTKECVDELASIFGQTLDVNRMSMKELERFEKIIADAKARKGKKKNNVRKKRNTKRKSKK